MISILRRVFRNTRFSFVFNTFGLVILAIAGLAISGQAFGQICSTDSNVAIADGSGSATPGAAASITIEVPAFYTSAISDLTFDLQIDHTYVGDLIVTLESPSGTVVTLMDRPGRPPTTFGCSQNNVAATFDDASGIPVETQCPAANPTIAGVLSPQGSLSDFDGEVPAGTWTLTVTDNAGQDTGTIISASNCLDVTTVPVVLSAFKSKQRGTKLKTQWQTASEAFNLGFNIWGNLDGEWTQLNRRIIPSHTVDSVEPLNYRHSVNLNALATQPTEIGISSISSSGFEEFYGPFEIGEKYGEITVPKAIDWSAQRDKHASAMTAAGFEFRNQRWRKKTNHSEKRAQRLQQRFPDVWLRIEENGVYRLTHDDLIAQGIDLSGLPIKHLALSHAGQPIARVVKGSIDKPRRFGAGSDIIFYANTPQGEQARYVDYRHIRLSTDISKVLTAPFINSDVENASSPSITHTKRVEFGQANGYSFIIPGDDPWYDEVIYAFGNTGNKVMNFSVDENADLDASVNVELNLMGGTSFDNIDTDGDGEVEPDHHFRVYLNRTEFPAPIYEGYSEKVDAVTIMAEVSGQLLLGANTLEIDIIPDNGHNIDAAYFLDASVSYQAHNMVNQPFNEFKFNSEQEWVSFETATDSNITVSRVFVYDNNNQFAEHQLSRQQQQSLFRLPPAIGDSTQRHAWLAAENGYLRPTNISVAPVVDNQSLDLQDVDYVLISHPSLQGADLDRFAAKHNELGRRTKIVSTHDIYNRYNDGMETPQAIANYLKHAASGDNGNQPSPFKYVLLVGGHTYNYLGYNTEANERPINLIPSFYRNGEGSINRQIPTAVPFVDFDQNGTPDRAIGRWPVRDLAQLKHVVDKTLAWHEHGSNKNNQHALLVAQQNEELNDFSASLERLSTNIGHSSNSWAGFDRVYFSNILADDTIADADKVTTARQRLTDGINQGPALTVYSGHASPTTWGKQNLLTSSVVDGFTNTSNPSLVIPLACYTTYYETPKVKSLAEQLFTDNAAGAVGLSGPALLSYASNNERFAKQLLILMAQQGHDLGTAVMFAKQALENSGERSQTVIYNWVTLADPTLHFDLPAFVDPVTPDTPKYVQ